MDSVIQIRQKQLLSFDTLEPWNPPREALIAGRRMIQHWIQTLPSEKQLIYGQSIVYTLVAALWQNKFLTRPDFSLPSYLNKKQLPSLIGIPAQMAEALGSSAAKLDIVEASYLVGSIYTATIPVDLRAINGIYYTPPALTERLLDLAEKAGIDWAKATVLDPACGGGAFLAPVALRMQSVLSGRKPNEIIDHIERHLKGYEIDAFSAWLSHVFLEIALSEQCIDAGRRLGSMIEIKDSLAIEFVERQFDLVIGNPPYGKIKLSTERRKQYLESLYGHANLYGLFVHLGFNLATPGGVIAYVTPTGFLGGEYFKKLRSFISRNGRPLAFDFISFRKGIFDDVLQETMLVTYKLDLGEGANIMVSEIAPDSERKYKIQPIGKFSMPDCSSAPWILSRKKHQAHLVQSLNKLKYRLSNWGYEVKTGPLVWNRHKAQLKAVKGKRRYPIIWAEAIKTNGEFVWQAEKKNHLPYFQFQPGNEWLVTSEPCVILQRTTAKEQQRRLICTVLPEAFINEHGGVVIENHLNLIRPVKENPEVDIVLLSSFLNSIAADNAFRCISGSVAVSAYELENLPLPAPESLKCIQKLLEENADQEVIESAFLSLY